MEHMRKKRNTDWVLVGKPEKEVGCLEDLDIDGIIILK
jgi:hypothetical protein